MTSSGILVATLTGFALGSAVVIGGKFLEIVLLAVMS